MLVHIYTSINVDLTESGREAGKLDCRSLLKSEECHCRHECKIPSAVQPFATKEGHGALLYNCILRPDVGLI